MKFENSFPPSFSSSQAQLCSGVLYPLSPSRAGIWGMEVASVHQALSLQCLLPHTLALLQHGISPVRISPSSTDPFHRVQSFRNGPKGSTAGLQVLRGPCSSMGSPPAAASFRVHPPDVLAWAVE